MEESSAKDDDRSVKETWYRALLSNHTILVRFIVFVVHVIQDYTAIHTDEPSLL